MSSLKIPWWMSLFCAVVCIGGAVLAFRGNADFMRFGAVCGWLSMLFLQLDDAKKDLDRRLAEVKHPAPPAATGGAGL